MLGGVVFDNLLKVGSGATGAVPEKSKGCAKETEMAL
jgi:hypothetical protein